MIGFSVEKSKGSKTRKIPLLPRVGLIVDFAGRKYTIRYVPLLETIRILVERGVTRSNLEKIQEEQIEEISFSAKKKPQTVNVRARAVEGKAESTFKKRFRKQ